jgi:sec-independent protein translocase protein TatC
MQTFTFREHFIELKSRLLKILCAFIVCFVIYYHFSDIIYNILLDPLAKLNSGNLRKVIYTGLTEAFCTYLQLAFFASFVTIMPIIAIQIYLFIRPGLHKNERKIAISVLLLSPILFWCGGFFVFYYVMPHAWSFFVSFERNYLVLPIVLEAKISEYLNIIIRLIIAFGIAFQLPIILIILNLLKIITLQNLRQKRRLAIVINFIIAGILTPPDVISQFALAIPLILLYEISIVTCKLIIKQE